MSLKKETGSISSVEAFGSSGSSVVSLMAFVVSLGAFAVIMAFILPEVEEEEFVLLASSTALLMPKS